GTPRVARTGGSARVGGRGRGRRRGTRRGPSSGTRGGRARGRRASLVVLLVVLGERGDRVALAHRVVVGLGAAQGASDAGLHGPALDPLGVRADGPGELLGGHLVLVHDLPAGAAPPAHAGAVDAVLAGRARVPLQPGLQVVVQLPGEHLPAAAAVEVGLAVLLAFGAGACAVGAVDEAHLAGLAVVALARVGEGGLVDGGMLGVQVVDHVEDGEVLLPVRGALRRVVAGVLLAEGVREAVPAAEARLHRADLLGAGGHLSFSWSVSSGRG